jgi:hypothetical protein
MPIKLKTKDFISLIEIFKMNDVMEINDAILKFTEEGFKVQSFTASKTASSSLKIKKDFFVEYDKEFGNIGLDDMGELISVLSKFKDTVTISKDNSILTIEEGKKKCETGLIDERYINDEFKEIELEYDINFDLTIKQLAEIFSSRDIKRKTTDSSKKTDIQIFLKIKDKKLFIILKDKYTFTHEVLEFREEDEIPDMTVKFGRPFFDAMNNFIKTTSKGKEMTEKINISIKEDYPMMVIKEDENYELKIIIAPLQNEEDD